jgi:Mn2+/Fe2+ NRAMP family transporter
MRCAYCGKELSDGESVSWEGQSFCNTIHRYAWKQSSSQTAVPRVRAGVEVSARSSVPLPEKNVLARKLIGSVLYTLVSYFLLVFILGMLTGGVAGMEAGQNGEDPAEAGRTAGENFAHTYGSFIFILCFILSTVGIFKGLLPMPRISTK